MKLSIVIICWNDRKVIADCLESIYAQTKSTEFEVIISDNGSTDDSLAFIRENYLKARIVENDANLGFARGNNAGIDIATGEYVLILNPDTILHDGALDRWIAFAARHPEAGAFGCKVLNSDGSKQCCAWPFPTLRRYWMSAFGLRWLGRLSPSLIADTYPDWEEMTEREIDWQAGCCLLIRGSLLKQLGGFDERFFYHFEETDLCFRVREAGYSIWYAPHVLITHLGGQSVGRFPIRFELEKYRNRYRYFEKHFSEREVRRCRQVSLMNLRLRRMCYRLMNAMRSTEARRNRLQMYRVVIDWNRRLDTKAFIQHGDEPSVGYEPLTPATSGSTNTSKAVQA